MSYTTTICIIQATSKVTMKSILFSYGIGPSAIKIFTYIKYLVCATLSAQCRQKQLFYTRLRAIRIMVWKQIWQTMTLKQRIHSVNCQLGRNCYTY